MKSVASCSFAHLYGGLFFTVGFFLPLAGWGPKRVKTEVRGFLTPSPLRKRVGVRGN
jgi:hypothetical protein